jgi:hypothetical protein
MIFVKFQMTEPPRPVAFDEVNTVPDEQALQLQPWNSRTIFFLLRTAEQF